MKILVIALGVLFSFAAQAQVCESLFSDLTVVTHSKESSGEIFQYKNTKYMVFSNGHTVEAPIYADIISTPAGFLERVGETVYLRFANDSDFEVTYKNIDAPIEASLAGYKIKMNGQTFLFLSNGHKIELGRPTAVEVTPTGFIVTDTRVVYIYLKNGEKIEVGAVGKVSVKVIPSGFEVSLNGNTPYYYSSEGFKMEYPKGMTRVP